MSSSRWTYYPLSPPLTPTQISHLWLMKTITSLKDTIHPNMKGSAILSRNLGGRIHNLFWERPRRVARRDLLQPYKLHPQQCRDPGGGGDSSVVRAPDSLLKGRGFESLLERRENFLLQGRLSVLTLISVSVPPPCYHSST